MWQHPDRQLGAGQGLNWVVVFGGLIQAVYLALLSQFHVSSFLLAWISPAWLGNMLKWWHFRLENSSFIDYIFKISGDDISIQLLTCNITLFGPLKGVIFPKWLYFPEARSAEGKYKVISLQVQRMFWIEIFGNYGKIICRDSSRKKKKPYKKKIYIQKFGGKKKKKNWKKKNSYPKKHFSGKKKKLPKKAFFGKKRKCGKNNFKGKKNSWKKNIEKIKWPSVMV